MYSDKDNLFIRVEKHGDFKDEHVKNVLKSFFDACSGDKEFRIRVKEGFQDKDWLKKEKSGWVLIKPYRGHWIVIAPDASIHETIFATRLEAVLSYVAK